MGYDDSVLTAVIADVKKLLVFRAFDAGRYAQHIINKLKSFKEPMKEWLKAAVIMASVGNPGGQLADPLERKKKIAEKYKDADEFLQIRSDWGIVGSRTEWNALSDTMKDAHITQSQFLVMSAVILAKYHYVAQDVSPIPLSSESASLPKWARYPFMGALLKDEHKKAYFKWSGEFAEAVTRKMPEARRVTKEQGELTAEQIYENSVKNSDLMKWHKKIAEKVFPLLAPQLPGGTSGIMGT